MITVQQEKPSIFVLESSTEPSILKELLAGIEEEGIPYDVKNISFTENTVLEKLHSAALQSRIGIAVAIISNRVILQHSKLKEEQPLLDVRLNFHSKRETARAIGSNAARLYKVIPFKDINHIEDELVYKIKAAVTSVLGQMDVKIF